VDTNVNEVNVVNQRIVHDELAHEMYELTINGNVLKVTDVHPFYVRKSESSKNYDWIDAQNLKVGDILLMNDGKLVKIEKINHYPNVETVYNLEVDGNHDYFVDK
jgi:intein/homing endonuclease